VLNLGFEIGQVKKRFLWTDTIPVSSYLIEIQFCTSEEYVAAVVVQSPCEVSQSS
jgi:hypothetical protein